MTVLVLETGLGPAAMERALGWALGGPTLAGVPYRPRVVISAGFSGALQGGLRVGDLVLATEVTDGEGNTWPAQIGQTDLRWPLHRGRLLSGPHLVAEPTRKQELGAEHQALAVDMETAVVARLCQGQGIPFGCLRAISDDVETALSAPLARVLRRGRVAPLRLVGAVLRNPAMVGELWRLARHTRLAARQLALGLGELLRC